MFLGSPPLKISSFGTLNSDSDQQRPKADIGRGPGTPLYSGDPILPAVRGETQSTMMPRRDETRPAGDLRSAMQIYYDNPILSRGIFSKESDTSAQGVERRTKLIENLRRQVGDFTSANPDPNSRADAMYRLARVAQFIDNDPGVERNWNTRLGDGFLDGNPSGASLSEEARLELYGEYGPIALEGIADGQAPGDTRTLEEITANPLFKELHQALSPEQLKAFKAKVGGDWESDSFPNANRIRFAANAERILRLVDSKGDNDSAVARRLVRFSEVGVPALRED